LLKNLFLGNMRIKDSTYERPIFRERATVEEGVHHKVCSAIWGLGL